MTNWEKSCEFAMHGTGVQSNENDTNYSNLSIPATILTIYLIF